MESRPQIQIYQFGHEASMVVVIDDFSRDPEQWRMKANAGDYQLKGDFYPGRRASVPPAYFEDVGPILGGIFRKAFGCYNHMSVERALYSIVSTPSDELSLAQRIPHIDTVATDHFAMVHYLSHEDFGGTGFYRHRSTGYEVITADRHRTYLDRLELDFSEKGVPASGYIAGDSDLFEQIGATGHKFNRAVLYRSNALHCSLTSNDRLHPDDPLKGRLTVAAFMLAR